MMDIYNLLHKCTGFEWDKHNSQKNWKKHRVTPAECERIFFNKPFIVANDLKHSKSEKRFYGLGKTDMQRELFVVFTLRENLIRVISVRNMSKREKRSYESYEKE